MVNLKKIGQKSLAELEALWGPLYEDVLGILGTTGIILAIGDPKQGQPNATTFLTRGLIPATNEFTFTWSGSGGPEAFATPFDLTLASNYQGIAPVVTFDGSADEADSPDAAYWSRDDTGGEGWSIGGWFNVTDTAAVRSIIERYDNDAALREFEFHITASDELALRLRDESASVTVQRVSDTAINLGVWTFLVATYDGAGGASAMDTVILYENGAVKASTATNNAGYVGMENFATPTTLGHNIAAGPAAGFLFDGKMAGGPLGPFFRQTVLTPDEITRLYELGRRALAL